MQAHLGEGISPASVILRHWYGFSDVSSAQASPSVDLPSFPPMATRKRLATRLSVWAYRALGPAPCTSTLRPGIEEMSVSKALAQAHLPNVRTCASGGGQDP